MLKLNWKRALLTAGLFIIQDPAPAQIITDFFPKAGTTNDMIDVIGSGFAASPQPVVQFWNRKTAPIVQISSDELIRVRVPAGATTGEISIYRGSGPTNFSSEPFIVIGLEPYVTDYSPTIGSVGEWVTFQGVHLANATVRFGSVRANETTGNVEGTELSAQIPAGATNGLITVSNAFGVFTSSAPFTVIGSGPYIASLEPQSGGGGSQFFIKGAHFTGVDEVKVNNTEVAWFFVQSDQQILAINQPDVTTGFVSVAGSGGSYTSSFYFYVPPVISSFSPTNGVAGTPVTVTGQNFLGITNVRVGGINASFTPPTNNTRLELVVPEGAPTGPIRVATPAGAQFSAANFRIPPTLTGFAPAFGAQGTNVTITGANLNEGLAFVRFNGVNATIVGSPAFNQVTVTVPPGAFTGPITLQTTNGSVSSVTNFFLPASITSFSPTNSPPGTTVTIQGQNLLGATAVLFNGLPANFVDPTTNTVIQATVPAGVTTGPISVVTPAGTAVNTNLVFYALPVITSFNPTHGFPGSSVSILGTNFYGVTAVQFNGANASFTVDNDNRIDASVPTNALTGPISVTGPAGTAVSAGPFTVDFVSDLKLSVTAAPDPVFVGSNLVYTISITSAGPHNALNAAVTSLLPASATLVSASTTLGTLNTNGNPVLGALGTLDAAGTATITLVVTPQEKGTIVNTTAVGSAYGDPTLSDNSAVVTTTVLPLPLLSIRLYSPGQMQVSWPSALTDFQLQYNTTLSNNSPWSNVLAPPITIGEETFVIDPMDSQGKFYRLKK